MDDILSDLPNFAHLEEIDLTGTELSAQSLYALLSAAPNLKKLNLHACKITGDITRNLPLHALEMLVASRSDLTTTTLQALLSQASNIRTIRKRVASSRGLTTLR
ncbi:MAG: hypothetical protein NTW94_03405 [Legionellales bacterium]|nr:hypothetical protein [Legionellales bacterium]